MKPKGRGKGRPRKSSVSEPEIINLDPDDEPEEVLPVSTKRGRKSQNKSAHIHNTRRASRVDVELQMECVDDELSPAQLKAIDEAQKEHEKANDLIKLARAGNTMVPASTPNTFTLVPPKLLKQAQAPITPAQPVNMSVLISNQVPVTNSRKAKGMTPPTAVDSQPMGLPPPRTAQFLNKQQNQGKGPAGVSVSSPPELILLKETQPQGVAISSPTPLPGQIPTNILGVTPQQVYKFVSLPSSTSPQQLQNQWAIRPLLSVNPQQQSLLVANAVQQQRMKVMSTFSIRPSGQQILQLASPQQLIRHPMDWEPNQSDCCFDERRNFIGSHSVSPHESCNAISHFKELRKLDERKPVIRPNHINEKQRLSFICQDCDNDRSPTSNISCVFTENKRNELGAKSYFDSQNLCCDICDNLHQQKRAINLNCSMLQSNVISNSEFPVNRPQSTKETISQGLECEQELNVSLPTKTSHASPTPFGYNFFHQVDYLNDNSQSEQCDTFKSFEANENDLATFGAISEYKCAENSREKLSKLCEPSQSLSMRDKIAMLPDLCKKLGFVKVSKETQIPKTQLLKLNRQFKQEQVRLRKRLSGKEEIEKGIEGEISADTKETMTDFLETMEESGKTKVTPEQQINNELGPNSETVLSVVNEEMNETCCLDIDAGHCKSEIVSNVKHDNSKEQLYLNIEKGQRNCARYEREKKCVNFDKQQESSVKTLPKFGLLTSEVGWIWTDYLKVEQMVQVCVIELGVKSPTVMNERRVDSQGFAEVNVEDDKENIAVHSVTRGVVLDTLKSVDGVDDTKKESKKKADVVDDIKNKVIPETTLVSCLKKTSCNTDMDTLLENLNVSVCNGNMSIEKDTVKSNTRDQDLENAKQTMESVQYLQKSFHIDNVCNRSDKLSRDSVMSNKTVSDSSTSDDDGDDGSLKERYLVINMLEDSQGKQLSSIEVHSDEHNHSFGNEKQLEEVGEKIETAEVEPVCMKRLSDDEKAKADSTQVGNVSKEPLPYAEKENNKITQVEHVRKTLQRESTESYIPSDYESTVSYVKDSPDETSKLSNDSSTDHLPVVEMMHEEVSKDHEPVSLPKDNTAVSVNHPEQVSRLKDSTADTLNKTEQVNGLTIAIENHTEQISELKDYTCDSVNHPELDNVNVDGTESHTKQISCANDDTAQSESQTEVNSTDNLTEHSYFRSPNKPQKTSEHEIITLENDIYDEDKELIDEKEAFCTVPKDDNFLGVKLKDKKRMLKLSVPVPDKFEIIDGRPIQIFAEVNNEPLLNKEKRLDNDVEKNVDGKGIAESECGVDESPTNLEHAETEENNYVQLDGTTTSFSERWKSSALGLEYLSKDSLNVVKVKKPNIDAENGPIYLVEVDNTDYKAKQMMLSIQANRQKQGQKSKTVKKLCKEGITKMTNQDEKKKPTRKKKQAPKKDSSPKKKAARNKRTTFYEFCPNSDKHDEMGNELIRYLADNNFFKNRQEKISEKDKQNILKDLADKVRKDSYIDSGKFQFFVCPCVKDDIIKASFRVGPVEVAKALAIPVRRIYNWRTLVYQHHAYAAYKKNPFREELKIKLAFLAKLYGSREINEMYNIPMKTLAMWKKKYQDVKLLSYDLTEEDYLELCRVSESRNDGREQNSLLNGTQKTVEMKNGSSVFCDGGLEHMKETHSPHVSVQELDNIVNEDGKAHESFNQKSKTFPNNLEIYFGDESSENESETEMIVKQRKNSETNGDAKTFEKIKSMHEEINKDIANLTDSSDHNDGDDNLEVLGDIEVLGSWNIHVEPRENADNGERMNVIDIKQEKHEVNAILVERSVKMGLNKQKGLEKLKDVGSEADSSTDHGCQEAHDRSGNVLKKETEWKDNASPKDRRTENRTGNDENDIIVEALNIDDIERDAMAEEKNANSIQIGELSFNIRSDEHFDEIIDLTLDSSQNENFIVKVREPDSVLHPFQIKSEPVDEEFDNIEQGRKKVSVVDKEDINEKINKPHSPRKGNQEKDSVPMLEMGVGDGQNTQGNSYFHSSGNQQNSDTTQGGFGSHGGNDINYPSTSNSSGGISEIPDIQIVGLSDLQPGQDYYLLDRNTLNIMPTASQMQTSSVNTGVPSSQIIIQSADVSQSLTTPLPTMPGILIRRPSPTYSRSSLSLLPTVIQHYPLASVGPINVGTPPLPPPLILGGTNLVPKPPPLYPGVHSASSSSSNSSSFTLRTSPVIVTSSSSAVSHAPSVMEVPVLSDYQASVKTSTVKATTVTPPVTPSSFLSEFEHYHQLKRAISDKSTVQVSPPSTSIPQEVYVYPGKDVVKTTTQAFSANSVSPKGFISSKPISPKSSTAGNRKSPIIVYADQPVPSYKHSMPPQVMQHEGKAYVKRGSDWLHISNKNKSIPMSLKNVAVPVTLVENRSGKSPVYYIKTAANPSTVVASSTNTEETRHVISGIVSKLNQQNVTIIQSPKKSEAPASADISQIPKSSPSVVNLMHLFQQKTVRNQTQSSKFNLETLAQAASSVENVPVGSFTLSGKIGAMTELASKSADAIGTHFQPISRERDPKAFKEKIVTQGEAGKFLDIHKIAETALNQSSEKTAPKEKMKEQKGKLDETDVKEKKRVQMEKFLDLSGYVSENQITKQRALMKTMLKRKISGDVGGDNEKKKSKEIGSEMSKTGNKVEGNAPPTGRRIDDLIRSMSSRMNVDVSTKSKKVTPISKEGEIVPKLNENRIESLVKTMQNRLADDKNEPGPSGLVRNRQESTDEHRPEGKDGKMLAKLQGHDEPKQRIDSLLSSVTDRLMTFHDLTQAAETCEGDQKSDTEKKMEGMTPPVSFDGKLKPESAIYENVEEKSLPVTSKRKGESKIRRDIRDVKKGVVSDVPELSTDVKTSSSSECTLFSSETNTATIDLKDSVDVKKDSEPTDLSEKLKSLLNADIFNVIESKDADDDSEEDDNEDDSRMSPGSVHIGSSEDENENNEEVDDVTESAHSTEDESDADTPVIVIPEVSTRKSDNSIYSPIKTMYVECLHTSPYKSEKTPEKVCPTITVDRNVHRRSNVNTDNQLSRTSPKALMKQSRGLVMKRTYPILIKKKIAKLASIFSMTSLSMKYGMNAQTISKWKQLYGKDEIAGLEFTGEELAIMKDVREERMSQINDKSAEKTTVKKVSPNQTVKPHQTVTSGKSKYQIYVDNPEEEIEEQTEIEIVKPTRKPSTEIETELLKPARKLSTDVELESVKSDNVKKVSPMLIGLLNSSKKNPASSSPVRPKRVPNILSRQGPAMKTDDKMTSSTVPMYIAVNEGTDDQTKHMLRQKLMIQADKGPTSLTMPQGIETMSMKKSVSSVFGDISPMKDPENNASVSGPTAPTEQSHMPGVERTVYLCPKENIFKYRYVNTSSKGSVPATTPNASIGDLIRASNKSKKFTSKADKYSEPTEAFKMEVVKEARKSGFERASKWFSVDMTDIMKWHDVLLNKKGEEDLNKNKRTKTSAQQQESDSDVYEFLVGETSGTASSKPGQTAGKKLNSGLSFDSYEVKEGAIKRPRFHKVGGSSEQLGTAITNATKSNRSRMGPNTTILKRTQENIHQLQQFKADVQGDLGIMPKLVKQSVSGTKDTSVEIASTWKQVQSVINPPKLNERKFSQEYKNRLMRECEVRGQKVISREYKIPFNELSRWRQEAKRLNQVVAKQPSAQLPKLLIPAPSTSTEKALPAAKSSDYNKPALIRNASDTGEVFVLSDDVTRPVEQEPLKIKIRFSADGQNRAMITSSSSESSIPDVVKRMEKQPVFLQPSTSVWPTKRSPKKVGSKSLKTKASPAKQRLAATENKARQKIGSPQDKNKVRRTSQLEDDAELRMQVINYCFDQGVLKTQKKFNITRQSIIDLMKEYEELSKYAAEAEYSQYKTKLVSREKTSVEVSTSQPVIVKNLTDYIVTQEYKVGVVDYARNHGITAASRKYKRKTTTIKSWVNEIERQETKKIQDEQIAKEIELLATKISQEEARKISFFEARKKRLQLENEFRNQYKKTVVDYAKDHGITNATKKYKKKAQTIKAWMGHLAKLERDAKKLRAEEASLPFTSSPMKSSESNLHLSISKPSPLQRRMSAPAEIQEENSLKNKNPPESPIWEQDFVIKPSTSSPLKLTLSPRRKSPVIVIGSSAEGSDDSNDEDLDDFDEDVNDIGTEDEDDNAVELSSFGLNALPVKSKALAADHEKLEIEIDIAEDSFNSTINLISEDEEANISQHSIPAKKATLKSHKSSCKETNKSIEDTIEDPEDTEQNKPEDDGIISPSDVPNILEMDRFVAKSIEQKENELEAEDLPHNENVVGDVDAIVIDEDSESDTEAVEMIPYEDTVMFKVLTAEMEKFFNDKTTTVKPKRKQTATKAKGMSADAEIMSNLDENLLFTGTRSTRQSLAHDITKNKKQNDSLLTVSTESEAKVDDDNEASLGNRNTDEETTKVDIKMNNYASKTEETEYAKSQSSEAKVQLSEKEAKRVQVENEVDPKNNVSNKADRFETGRELDTEGDALTSERRPITGIEYKEKARIETDSKESIKDVHISEDKGSITNSETKATEEVSEMPPVDKLVAKGIIELKKESVDARKSEKEENTNGTDSQEDQMEKKDRSLFDMLEPREGKLPSEIKTVDITLTENATGPDTYKVGDSSPKPNLGLFGNLMKSFKMPGLAINPVAVDIKGPSSIVDENSTESIVKTPQMDDESVVKDKSERNVFDLIGSKEEPIESSKPEAETRSLFKHAVIDSPTKRSLRSSTKINTLASSNFETPKISKKKPMFKFPKMALNVNFGNIAKLGISKLKEEAKLKTETYKLGDDNVYKSDSIQSDTESLDLINKHEEDTVTQSSVAVSKTAADEHKEEVQSPGVIIETFEQLRQRLTKERAALKAEKLKQKEREASIEIEKESKEVSESDKPNTNDEDDAENEEMYKGFAPEKIVLILDISKKHGINFACSSFGLPASVIVNWIIEKDRKHRRVSLSISLEAKLTALRRIKNNEDESGIGKELKVNVNELKQWENELGWILKQRNVENVLDKWSRVENVSDLDFQKCNEKLQRQESSSGKLEKSEKATTSLQNSAESEDKELKQDEVKDTLSMKMPELNEDKEILPNNISQDSATETAQNEETIIVLDTGDESSDKKADQINESTDGYTEIIEIPDDSEIKETDDKKVLEKVGVDKLSESSQKIDTEEAEKNDTKAEHATKIESENEDTTEIATEVSNEVNNKPIEESENIEQTTQPENQEQEQVTVPDILLFARSGNPTHFTVEQKAMCVVLAKKFGIKDVGKKLGVSQGTLWRWVNRKTVISDLIDEQKAGYRKTKRYDECKSVESESRKSEVRKDNKIENILETVIPKPAVTRSRAAVKEKGKKEKKQTSMGYRTISPSKLPIPLHNIENIDVKDFTLEQKVAIIKLVELYGVRQIHKQFQIPASSIWNWQNSKVVKEEMNAAGKEPEVKKSEAEKDKKAIEFEPEDDEEKLNIDVIFDRTLVAIEDVNYMDFKLVQKADVVHLINHFGIEYVCEKLPQIPRGTLWNWRHSRHVLPLVAELETDLKKAQELIAAKAVKAQKTQVGADEIDKNDMTQKWLRECHSSGRKRSGNIREGSVESSKRRKIDVSEKAMSVIESDRFGRSSSPSSFISDISIHSEDEFEEIISDTEGTSPSIHSKRSVTSGQASHSSKVGGKKGNQKTGKAKDSGKTSCVPAVKLPEEEIKEPVYEVLKIECGEDNRLMVHFKTDPTIIPMAAETGSSKRSASDTWQGPVAKKKPGKKTEDYLHVQDEAGNIVHLSNKVLMCRICEKDFNTQKELASHMSASHYRSEMPYVCQLCNFRSSMYSDVVDHFKKRHDSSNHLLCFYCLRSFEVKFVSQGWGQTQTYYGHLLKHQSRASTKKCVMCRLTFFNAPDVKNHRRNCHISANKNQQGFSPGSKNDGGLKQKKTNIKSLNAPSISKIQDIGEVKFPAATQRAKCVECKMIMASTDHYKKFIHCSMCRFATSCSVAYANHMMGFHSGQMSSLNLNIPWERQAQFPLFCACGYTSKFGNKLANHMVGCIKSVCYTRRPEQTGDTTAKPAAVAMKDMAKESDSASVLGVLGLVQKKTVTTRIRAGPKKFKLANQIPLNADVDEAERIDDVKLDNVGKLETEKKVNVEKRKGEIAEDIKQEKKEKISSEERVDLKKDKDKKGVTINTENDNKKEEKMDVMVIDEAQEDEKSNEKEQKEQNMDSENIDTKKADSKEEGLKDEEQSKLICKKKAKEQTEITPADGELKCQKKETEVKASVLEDKNNIVEVDESTTALKKDQVEMKMETASHNEDKIPEEMDLESVDDILENIEHGELVKKTENSNKPEKEDKEQLEDIAETMEKDEQTKEVEDVSKDAAESEVEEKARELKEKTQDLEQSPEKESTATTSASDQDNQIDSQTEENEKPEGELETEEVKETQETSAESVDEKIVKEKDSQEKEIGEEKREPTERERESEERSDTSERNRDVGDRQKDSHERDREYRDKNRDSSDRNRDSSGRSRDSDDRRRSSGNHGSDSYRRSEERSHDDRYRNDDRSHGSHSPPMSVTARTREIVTGAVTTIEAGIIIATVDMVMGDMEEITGVVMGTTTAGAITREVKVIGVNRGHMATMVTGEDSKTTVTMATEGVTTTGAVISRITAGIIIGEDTTRISLSSCLQVLEV
ncbi:POGZ-like protein [Mya arenaria]|uniref:POGZ-like protein n=1 Tax=Mya arenaria TaxID=6604 RepID=A0ABY7ERK7_MYAAR|nr:POGZ-like protein [Mya arenaria]